MENSNYVISIKRVKSYDGTPIPEDEQYFEYAGLDRYSGAMSTGYPVFLSKNHGER